MRHDDRAASVKARTDGLADVIELPPPGPTREQIRSRRKHATRAKTISSKRTTKGELALLKALNAELAADVRDHLRPKTRADCIDGPRPCPWVSCKFHLYLDVSPKSGAVKLNFPDLEPHEMHDTCVLDVADRGGAPLEAVGQVMNLTRERIRQVEVRALAKLAALRDEAVLCDYVDGGPIGKRRLPIIQGDGT